MNLKVTHKVILGFTVISLLLIFTSTSSIRILGKISNATDQVANFAIPVQHLSNKVQILLLKQSKLSSTIPSQTQLQQLIELEKKLHESNNELNQQVQKIKALLAKQPELKFITQFTDDYSPYLTTVNKMIAHKKSILEQYAQLVTRNELLTTRFRNIEDQLVDLSYLEDPNNEDLIEQISSASVPIESYIVNMGETLNNLVDINNQTEAVNVQETIEMGLTNTIPLLDFLKRLTQDHMSYEKVVKIAEESERLKTDLLAESNIFTLKNTQLTQIAELSQLLLTSEQQANVSIDSIDELLSKFNHNVETLQNDVFDNVSQGKTTTWTLLIVILLASLLISYATVRSMSRPLARINKVLSFIAKGDLSRQLKVESNDEYGYLSKNVNLVVADLRKLVGEMSSNSNLLNTAAEQSSGEIAEVVSSLEKQQQTVTRMTTVTSQLTCNADQVLQQAKTAEQQMNEALKQSDDLKSIANITNQRISSLVDELDTTSEIMATLQQESDNIGGIIQTIQSIADQTNLLALNAAIEAARAGESGRGFAVVADEVRMLASRTQESTAEINTMITSLQKQTQKAVADLNEGKTEATNCKQHTDTLLATLLLINQAIEQMHLMSLNIAESANEQSSLSNEINHSIKDVVELGDYSNNKSLSTLSHSEQVASLAQKLDKSVDQFNL